MNIQNITAFLTIIRTGNISKAANELYLTQSAVSHRLRALEEEVNAPLIVRQKGKQNITLTNKGEEFIHIAERWQALLKDTNRLAAAEERHYLSIASVDSLNIYLFTPLYRRLMALEGAGLNLRIRTHQSNEIYTLLDMQEIDMGFVLRPLVLKNIHTQELMREQMVLIKRCKEPQPELGEISVRDLDPAKEFFIDWSPAFHTWHEHWWPMVVRPKLQCDTAALIMKLMEDDDSWSIVSLPMAREFQKTEHYQVYNIVEQPPDRVIYKLTHKYPKPSSLPALELVERYLEEFLRTKHQE